ncbi:MAG: hypothetical protein HMLKMBBP_03444 [Planctomycetes bacterium]|nr:hypothetical protein [Planctomycetota bacterium]
MRVRAGRFVAAGLAAAWALVAAPAFGDGVVSGGATIEAGAGSPQGAVTIDSCAPMAEPPQIPPVTLFGGAGSQTTSAPAFGGAGPGGSAFASSQALTTLAAGTYTHASFTVSSGHTVRFDGAVVIRVTGDVRIEGVLETFSAGDGSISIHAGGTLTVQRQAGAACGVNVSGSGGGSVTLDAAGAVSVGGTQPGTFRASVGSPGFAVSIVSQDATTGIVIDGANVGQSGGAVTLDAPRVSASNANLAAGGSHAAVRSRAATASLTDVNIAGGSAALEATGGLTLLRTGLTATSGDVLLAAYSGDLALDGSTVSALGGGAFVEAKSSGGISLDNDAELRNNAGSILILTAYGGDVRIDTLGGSASSNVIAAAPTGSVGINASRDILVHADADLAGENGLSLTAVRDVAARGSPLLRAGTGGLTLRAGGALVIGSHMGSPAPDLVFGSCGATAADGSASIALGFIVATGAFELTASGDVTLTGSLTAQSIAVASLGGDVTAAGATLASAASAGDSGAVSLTSYAGCEATVDVSNATIRSGDATGASGAVTVVVRDDEPPVVGSVLVTSVKVNERASGNDRVVVQGTIDTGAEDDVPEGAFVVVAGTFEQTFQMQRRGRTLRGTAGGATLVVKEPRGGSRLTFTLTFTGDSTLVIDGGTLTFGVSRFVTGSGGGFVVYGDSTVNLESGRFVIGRQGSFEAGSSVIVLDSATLKLSDTKDDRADVAWIIPGAPLVLNAPSVRFEVGGLVIDADASVFVVESPGVFFVPEGSVPGLRTARLDFNEGTVEFSGTGTIVVGDGAEVVFDSTVTIDGGAPLVVSVRVARKGRKLTY